MSMRWMIPPSIPELSAAAASWGLPRLVAQLLLNRGINVDQDATEFLSPRMSALLPPKALAGTVAAAELIVTKLRTSKKIVVYGDYDVDGTTGVAILWHMLKLAGANVSFYVPHRVEEGYGLNEAAAHQLISEGTDTVITVDCGVTAVEVAKVFKKAGVTLIITDHHTPQSTLPQADAIVHPLLDREYPNQALSGSGVAFKLAWGIAQSLSGEDHVSPEARDLLVELLPLAALGTIADSVALNGENRIIAKHGLAKLSSSSIPGLRMLVESAGLGGSRLTGYDVAFKLAPRINAAGRMGHARLAVELFTRADENRAREISLYLDEHNRSRKATDRKILEQAIEIIESQNLASDARRAIVVASEGWHAGVIGIVAARIVDRYRRPTIVISLRDGVGQGSARSLPAFDMGAALGACEEHLLAHGGHKMAAGLRIAADRLEAFTEAFVTVANNRLTAGDLVERLRLDAEVMLDELSLPTMETIAGLGPFGVGNPTPRFATDWIDLADEPRRVGASRDHLSASFRQNGKRIRAIGFGKGSAIEDLKQHRRCRVAFEPLINEFHGRRTVEMQIVDLQFPGQGP